MDADRRIILTSVDDVAIFEAVMRLSVKEMGKESMPYAVGVLTVRLAEANRRLREQEPKT